MPVRAGRKVHQYNLTSGRGTTLCIRYANALWVPGRGGTVAVNGEDVKVRSILAGLRVYVQRGENEIGETWMLREDIQVDPKPDLAKNEVRRIQVGSRMKYAPMLGREVVDHKTGVMLLLHPDGSVRWEELP